MPHLARRLNYHTATLHHTSYTHAHTSLFTHTHTHTHTHTPLHTHTQAHTCINSQKWGIKSYSPNPLNWSVDLCVETESNFWLSSKNFNYHNDCYNSNLFFAILGIVNEWCWKSSILLLELARKREFWAWSSFLMVKYTPLKDPWYNHNKSRRNITNWNVFCLAQEKDCQKFINSPPELVWNCVSVTRKYLQNTEKYLVYSFPITHHIFQDES